MSRLKHWCFLVPVAGLALVAGCMHTTHEVEVKPMHITVDVNVRVQNELRKEFRSEDETMKQITDEEAAAALERYLNDQAG